jgi:hypothetical protein
MRNIRSLPSTYIDELRNDKTIYWHELANALKIRGDVKKLFSKDDVLPYLLQKDIPLHMFLSACKSTSMPKYHLQMLEFYSKPNWRNYPIKAIVNDRYGDALFIRRIEMDETHLSMYRRMIGIKKKIGLQAIVIDVLSKQDVLSGQFYDHLELLKCAETAKQFKEYVEGHIMPKLDCLDEWLLFDDKMDTVFVYLGEEDEVNIIAKENNYSILPLCKMPKYNRHNVSDVVH